MDLPPVGGLDLPGRPFPERDPGVRHEQVDRAELALDLRDHRVDLLTRGDVRDDGEPADLARHFLDLIRAAGRDRDPHPGAC